MDTEFGRIQRTYDGLRIKVLRILAIDSAAVSSFQMSVFKMKYYD